MGVKAITSTWVAIIMRILLQKKIQTQNFFNNKDFYDPNIFFFIKILLTKFYYK